MQRRRLPERERQGINRTMHDVGQGLQSWLEPFQLAKPFYDEFLGIEIDRIAAFASPSVDTIQERQSILIKDENMKPPPAIRIGFLTINEPMAMLVQDTTDAIAEVIEHPFLGSTSLGHRPPISRFEIGAHRKRLGREPDGAEVCQQVSGQGLKVAHVQVFIRAPSKPCSKCMRPEFWPVWRSLPSQWR
jgi:hypothetical protein